MPTNPWWYANGAVPVAAWKDGVGFFFNGPSVIVYRQPQAELEVSIAGAFAWVLTGHQVHVFMQLEREGRIIPGVWETWEQFSAAHKIDEAEAKRLEAASHEYYGGADAGK